MGIITAGNKVLPGEAALLKKLNINPFSYGMKIKAVYDNGAMFSPEVLDLTDDDLGRLYYLQTCDASTNQAIFQPRGSSPLSATSLPSVFRLDTRHKLLCRTPSLTLSRNYLQLLRPTAWTTVSSRLSQYEYLFCVRFLQK